MPLPCIVSLGDPAGIGPEIITKAWEMGRLESRIVVVAPPQAIQTVWSGPIDILDRVEDHIHAKGLPLLPIEWSGEITPGQPSCEQTRLGLKSLEKSCSIVLDGLGCNLVTAPIHKALAYAEGFHWPGQTEYIAQACSLAEDQVAMMMAIESHESQPNPCRTVPITIHVPLAHTPMQLTPQLLTNRARIVHRAMQTHFRIKAPRIAVAGLNPHAGEDGRLGSEEIEIIAPAISRLQAEGMDISGPYAADSLFHDTRRCDYDVALCMYHDQALIPVKTLDVNRAVNVTLGLPFLRTSPDHGTAFEIAGQNRANAGSMLAALRLAIEAETKGES